MSIGRGSASGLDADAAREVVGRVGQTMQDRSGRGDRDLVAIGGTSAIDDQGVRPADRGPEQCERTARVDVGSRRLAGAEQELRAVEASSNRRDVWSTV